MTRQVTPDQINSLKPNEVFVFGSNASGFHGAGSAGLACRGDAANTWRTDSWFLNAMKSHNHSIYRIGYWAVYGISRGHQIGTTGQSYAIETIKQPGLKRSTPLSEIALQIKELSDFAIQNPQLTFLVTKIGSSLAGYSLDEIKEQFAGIYNLPDNIILPKEYEFRE